MSADRQEKLASWHAEVKRLQALATTAIESLDVIVVCLEELRRSAARDFAADAEFEEARPRE